MCDRRSSAHIEWSRIVLLSQLLPSRLWCSSMMRFDTSTCSSRNLLIVSYVYDLELPCALMANELEFQYRGALADDTDRPAHPLEGPVLSPQKRIPALRGNRTPGGSMATTQVTTTPLMLGNYARINQCQQVKLCMVLSPRMRLARQKRSFVSPSCSSVHLHIYHLAVYEEIGAEGLLS